MKLGFVIGRISLNRKDPSFEGDRWLMVSPIEKSNFKALKFCVSKAVNLVVYDSMNSRLGDVIGYVEGAEAAVAFNRPTPVDAYSVAIIDKINYFPEAK